MSAIGGNAPGSGIVRNDVGAGRQVPRIRRFDLPPTAAERLATLERLARGEA
jgi:hypothetical protein